MLPHFTWSYTTTTHKPTPLTSLFSLPHFSPSLHSAEAHPSPIFTISFTSFEIFKLCKPSSSQLKLETSNSRWDLTCMCCLEPKWGFDPYGFRVTILEVPKDDHEMILVRLIPYLAKAFSWIITFGNDSNEEPNVYIYICEMMILNFMIWDWLLVFSKGVMFWWDFSVISALAC